MGLAVKFDSGHISIQKNHALDFILRSHQHGKKLIADCHIAKKQQLCKSRPIRYCR